jgi:hypothetical protein
MVQLLLVRAVAATPSEVVQAYRNSIESRPSTEDRLARSEVSMLEDGRIRFSAQGQARVGAVRIDGIVTWEAEDAWTCRREVEVDGHPYSWEIEKYHVAAREGGSDVTLNCELHARGPLQEALLGLAKGRLLTQRFRELDRWLPGVPAKARKK